MSLPRPKATHEGSIDFTVCNPPFSSNIKLSVPCANLDNGSRVLNEAEFLEVLGRKGNAPGRQQKNGFDKLPTFLAAENLQPFVNKHLTASTNFVWYTPLNGGKAKGYQAELLPQVCKVYWEAHRAGALRKDQLHIAVRCEDILSALINVAIVALVDEATGYQVVRPKDTLQAMFEMYLRKDAEPWKRKFVEEFYIEIHRLKGWDYTPYKSKRSPIVGTITIDLVYKRIQPGLWDELLKINPNKKRYKYHQFLTKHIGNKHLRDHLREVTRIMSACNSWNQFKAFLDRTHPVSNNIQMNIFFDLLTQSPEDFDKWSNLVS